MRYIVERDASGHWTCFQDGQPELAVGGPSPVDALQRFAKTHVDRREARLVEETEGRFILAEPSPCPDCRGTGVYVGLNVTEDCSMCKGGSGGRHMLRKTSTSKTWPQNTNRGPKLKFRQRGVSRPH